MINFLQDWLIGFLTRCFSQITELKRLNRSAPGIEDNPIGYKIQVINRGDELFYWETKTDRAIIIQIAILKSFIFSDSITRWDNGKKVSEEEKKIILQRLINYFEKYDNTKYQVV